MAEIGISCATCTRYEMKDDKTGVCKANPPQVLVTGARPHPVTGAPQLLTQAAWPVVGAADWCARHDGFGARMAVPIDRRLAANAEGEA